MKLRNRRHLISVGYFIISNVFLMIVVLIIGSSGDDTNDAIGLLIIGNHFLVFLHPGYRRAIQRLFISTERCYNCGLEIDLNGLWHCQCGSNTVRHILSRCRSCKTYTHEITCPQCEVTIDV